MVDPDLSGSISPGPRVCQGDAQLLSSAAVPRTPFEQARSLCAALRESIQELTRALGSQPVNRSATLPDLASLSAAEIEKLGRTTVDNLTRSVMSVQKDLAAFKADLNRDFGLANPTAAGEAIRCGSTAASLVARARALQEKHQEEESLRAQLKELNQAYNQKRLADLGLNSFEELVSRQAQIREDPALLSPPWWKPFHNWTKRRGIDRETVTLRDLARLSYEPLFVCSLEVSFTEKYDLENLARTLSQTLAGKLSIAVKETMAIAREALANANPSPASQELLSSFREDYIHRIFLEELRAELSRHHAGEKLGLDLTNDTWKQAAPIVEAEGLVRAALEHDFYDVPWGASEDERARSAELQQRVEQFPSELRIPVEREIRWLGWHNSQTHFEQMYDWVSGAPFRQDGAALAQSLGEVKQAAAQLTGTVERCLEGYSSDFRDLERTLGEIQEAAAPPLEDKFAVEFDPGFWRAFRESEKIGGRFGQSVMEASSRELGESVLKKLLVSPEHQDQTIKLGYKLLGFPGIDFVPFVVINAFREPGYSGEMPFISNSLGDASNCELVRYLHGLDAQELAAIEALQIPGLMQAIQLVCQSPNSFQSRYLAPEEGSSELKDNPVYFEVRENIQRMCLYYLDTADEPKQLFALRYLVREDLPLDEAALETLERATRAATSVNLRAALEKLVLERSRFSGPKPASARWMLGLLAKNTTEPTPDTKCKAAILLKPLLNEPLTDEDFTNLSRLSGYSASELRAAHSFVTSLRFQLGYGSEPYEILNAEPSQVLDEFVRAASVPQSLETIMSLQQHGYTFDRAHLALLPDMIRARDRVVRRIKSVQRDWPDFRYEPARFYEYNAAQGKSSARFVLDPYLAAVSKFSNGEKLFEFLGKVKERHGYLPFQFARAFFVEFTRNNPAIRLPAEPPAVAGHYAKLREDLDKVIDVLARTPEDTPQPLRQILLNRDTHTFLAARPDQIDSLLNIQQGAPELMALLRAAPNRRDGTSVLVGNIMQYALAGSEVPSLAVPQGMLRYFKTLPGADGLDESRPLEFHQALAGICRQLPAVHPEVGSFESFLFEPQTVAFLSHQPEKAPALLERFRRFHPFLNRKLMQLKEEKKFGFLEANAHRCLPSLLSLDEKALAAMEKSDYHPAFIFGVLGPMVALDKDSELIAKLIQLFPRSSPVLRDHYRLSFMAAYVEDSPAAQLAVLRLMAQHQTRLSDEESLQALSMMAFVNALGDQDLAGRISTRAEAQAVQSVSELYGLALNEVTEIIANSYPRATLLEMAPEDLRRFVQVYAMYERSLVHFNARAMIPALRVLGVTELRHAEAKLRANDAQYLQELIDGAETYFPNQEERAGVCDYLRRRLENTDILRVFPAGRFDPARRARLLSIWNDPGAEYEHALDEVTVEDRLISVQNTLQALFQHGHLSDPLVALQQLITTQPIMQELAQQWQLHNQVLLDIDPARATGKQRTPAGGAEAKLEPIRKRAGALSGPEATQYLENKLKEIEQRQDEARTWHPLRSLNPRCAEKLRSFQHELHQLRTQLGAYHQEIEALGFSFEQSFGPKVYRGELHLLRQEIEEDRARSLADRRVPDQKALSEMEPLIERLQQVYRRAEQYLHELSHKNFEPALRALIQKGQYVAELLEFARGDASLEACIEKIRSRDAPLAEYLQKRMGSERSADTRRQLFLQTLQQYRDASAIEDINRALSAIGYRQSDEPEIFVYRPEYTFSRMLEALTGQCLDYRLTKNSVGNCVFNVSFQEPIRQVVTAYDKDGTPRYDGVMHLVSHKLSDGEEEPAIMLDRTYVCDGSITSWSKLQGHLEWGRLKACAMGLPLIVPNAVISGYERHFQHYLEEHGIAPGVVEPLKVRILAGPSGATYCEIKDFTHYVMDSLETIQAAVLRP